jgi:hypothetical protein
MLTEILARMISNVEIGQTRQVRRLKNGLVILIEPRDDDYLLILGRDNIYPSIHEWNTVVRNFPYPITTDVKNPSEGIIMYKGLHAFMAGVNKEML